ncbi:MAG: RNA-binding protein [Candidatus Pacearchaeota archaeon]|nr:RNA-binding protein [Candidatus Pacearchaeota archaeon]
MKLYIGNLPFSIDDEGLKNLFSEYNPEEVSLIKDKFSGRSKGFGFVTISDDEVAKKAISEMNGKDVEGRELKVSEARPMEDMPRRPPRNFGGGGSGGSRGNFNRRRF